MRAVGGGAQAALGDVLLSVEDVSLSFGGVKAVSNVSFDIRKGVISARVKIRDMQPVAAPPTLEKAA